jgi:hypothetical protein
VQEALDELRAKLGEGERVDFGELVALGAQVKARRLPDHDQRGRRARRVVVVWIRAGSGPAVDVSAADEVKRLGLIAHHGE